MAHLVDSGVIIGIERRRIAHGRLADLTDEEDAAISAITASELLIGVLRSDTAARRSARHQFVEGVLDAFPIIPFETRAARVHAELSAELVAAGEMIGANDLIIAATALAHGYSVLTDNVRDFGRVPGLVVTQPNWSAADQA